MNWNLIHNENGKYQFKNNDSKLSEEFFFAHRYYSGFAVVQKEKNDLFQYRDSLGTLSEGFYEANNYNGNYALVKKERNSQWQIRDTHGNLYDKWITIDTPNYHGFEPITDNLK